MKNFDFTFYGNIRFGSGTRTLINDIIKKEKYKSACIVIDHHLLSIDIFNEFVKNIKCNYILITCDIQEPTYEKLEEKRKELLNKSIDFFIGIGGGSALDMAKGLSVLYSNVGTALSYRGFEKFNPNILPIIALPTTAGTGSEITPNASFIDRREKRKMGINGEAIRPKFAILDPELTLTCPHDPTLSAAIDSIVHSTEAFVAKKSNPMAKIFAKKGFSLVIENITDLMDNMNNLKLREEVMFGAFLSAIALMNSGTGPAAAMSYPLGVRFGVPHGIGGGIFLQPVIKSNILNGYNGYNDLYNFSSNGISTTQIFMSAIDEIWKDLEIPNDLKKFGMKSDDINDFISDTLDLKLALDQNPVNFGSNEIKNVLKNLNVGS